MKAKNVESKILLRNRLYSVDPRTRTLKDYETIHSMIFDTPPSPYSGGDNGMEMLSFIQKERENLIIRGKRKKGRRRRMKRRERNREKWKL